MVFVMVLCAYVLTFRQKLGIIIQVNAVNTSKGITVMKIIVKLITLVLATVLAVSLCACASQSNSNTGQSQGTSGPGKSNNPDNQTKNTTASPVTDKTDVPDSTQTADSTQSPADLPYTVTTPDKAKVGDVIVFGTYEQDGNTANGKEPLEWLVLASKDNSLLLVTLYGIEHMQFHSSLEKVTWETSALRKWLNNDFIQIAFSTAESDAIKKTTVVAEKNPEYPNSPAGNDTEDKVFILSIQEAESLFTDNNSRKCSPTEAAIAAEPGAFSRMSSKAWYAKQSYGCSWWLRSPGMYKDLYVSYVGKYGNITGGGQVNMSGTDFCVRPAMWITSK